MIFSITNIFGLAGLIIIFIIAGLFRNGMEWLPGVLLLLVVLAIRNIAMEITRKKEIILSVSVFIIVSLTLLFIIN